MLLQGQGKAPRRTDPLSKLALTRVHRLWLADMAANLPPTVRFDGFDISLEQAPASGFHHPNIQMHRWDMFQDPPAKYMGQFDIVHVRLVTLVIKNNDPIPLVRNLRKLLSEYRPRRDLIFIVELTLFQSLGDTCSGTR